MILETLALAALIDPTYKPKPPPPEPPKPIVKVVQAAPEPTLEEKIATNFYKCDETVQWIRADNAQCLAKVPPAPENPAKPPQNTSYKPSTGLNGYEYPSCTGYVASRRHVPAGLGYATTWFSRASSFGLSTGSVPVAGAIGWRYGHVVYVESVNGMTITISEANYDYHGSIRTRSALATEFSYIY